jgi:biopolymer transport protein ExbD
MRRAGVRRGRGGAGGGGHGPLMLVPMIDILTILVVYLLVHAADTEILANTRNVSIPQSVAEQKPRESTVITVTRDTLYVNGDAVLKLEELRAAPGPVIEPLRAALASQPRSLVGDDSGRREVTLMAERTLPYAVLRKVIASSAAADYLKVSMAVVERQQALAAVAMVGA